MRVAALAVSIVALLLSIASIISASHGHFRLTQLEVTSAGVVVSAAALGGTLAAIVVALRTANRTDERWQQDKDDRQKGHARLVQIVPDGGLTSDKVMELVIVNNGPESIQQVGIVDITPRREGTTVRGNLQLYSPALRPTVGMIKPLDKAEFFMHCLDAERHYVSWPVGPKEVTIEFMDAQGKLWRRSNYDEPEPITELTWTPDKVQLMPLPDPEPDPSPDPEAGDPCTS